MTLLSAKSGERLRSQLTELVMSHVEKGKKVLVGCSLAVRRALTGETGSKLGQAAAWHGASLTHFGAFIGSNSWKDYDVVIVIGREQPPVEAVENIARALWPTEDLAFCERLTKEARGYDLRSGERAGVEVDIHPDPHMQMVMELFRERQTAQLVDRLRLLYPDDRAPEIIVVSNLPVPGLTVDELVTLPELLDGGSPWTMALRELNGAVPLHGQFLSDRFLMSTHFGLPRSTARNVEQLKREPWRRPAGTAIIQYRIRGARGPTSSALVSTGLSDPASVLAVALGVSLSEITLAPAQTEKLCHAPIVAGFICERHAYRQAAQKVVDELPCHASLEPHEINKLVEEQISEFAAGLVKCVERATEAAGNVEKLPMRARQGAALREVGEALERLCSVVERNWELTKPLLEIEYSGQMGRLLTTEATRKLLPTDMQADFIQKSENNNDDSQLQLKRSYLLDAGSWPLMELIKSATTTVRRAEMGIPAGAPLKVPLEMALIMQLANHFERALQQKASWMDGGPFSRFSLDVFESLELPSAYSWEHLLRESLKLHRSSFVTRRQYERHDHLKSDGGQSRKQKPRKQKLAPLTRPKTI